jgi:Ribosomal protein S16
VTDLPPWKILMIYPFVFVSMFSRIHSKVGTYNPVATRDGIKEIRLKIDRLKYWLSCGAQPSDRVSWILGKFGVLPPPPPRISLLKKVPKSERKET